MENELKKGSTGPSSQTADDSGVESKPKKKKKGLTGKGLKKEGEISKEDRIKQKLENSSFMKELREWRSFIMQQRKDLRSAKPLIDDAAPRLNVSMLYDQDLLKATFQQLKGAFEMNRHVVKGLYEVNVLPGKTDTFKFKYSKTAPSNYSFRKGVAKSIEKQNQMLHKIFTNPRLRVTSVKEHAENWKTQEAIIESFSQFPLWWKVQEQEESVEIGPPSHYYEQHITEKSAKYPDKRPRVFFEISIKNVGIVGKMVAILYSDYVPMTVKNFLAFCDPKANLTYKGNFFYFIFPQYYCQTGDVVENRGFGGTSIYGPYFGNEDFTLKHRERGMLTMYSKLPNRNDSQFIITFRQLESLDGKNVVFGKIVKGLHVLDAIESVGSKKMGRPKVEIFISDCDEI